MSRFNKKLFIFIVVMKESDLAINIIRQNYYLSLRNILDETLVKQTIKLFIN